MKKCFFQKIGEKKIVLGARKTKRSRNHDLENSWFFSSPIYRKKNTPPCKLPSQKNINEKNSKKVISKNFKKLKKHQFEK